MIKEYFEFIIPVKCGTLPQSQMDWYLQKSVGNVIRCKECKYGEKAGSVYLCGKSRSFGIAHEPEWFCADGELYGKE